MLHKTDQIWTPWAWTERARGHTWKEEEERQGKECWIRGGNIHSSLDFSQIWKMPEKMKKLYDKCRTLPYPLLHHTKKLWQYVGGKKQSKCLFSLQVFIGIESFLRTFLFLEVVGVLWRVTPKAWTQTKLLQIATSFGALLHFQARSLKKCIQAV